MAKRRIEVCRITEPIIRQVTNPYVLQLASPWIHVGCVCQTRRLHPFAAIH